MASEERKSVYLDYNATTPYAVSVKQAMLAATELWGNPSSNYKRGAMAKELVEKSRKLVAEMIEARDSEIIFVSGGTEANNVAIRSVSEENQGLQKPHVVSTSIEHDATLKLLEHMMMADEISVSFIPTNSDGSVDPNEVKRSLKEDTVLVTLMIANNETGGITDLKTLSRILEDENSLRRKKGLQRIYLHVDAAQAVGKIPVSVLDTPVDYMTIVGHKFYGPRIGALYVKEGSPVRPLVRGGGQERGRRSGTENTVCIAGLGEAAKLVRENIALYQEHFARMKYLLKAALLKEFTNGTCIINFPEGSNRPQLPNTLSVSFPGQVGGEILLSCPELEASTGAACHSSANCKSASGILLKLIPEPQAKGTLRLSIGRETTEEDINLAVSYLKEGIGRLITKGEDCC